MAAVVLLFSSVYFFGVYLPSRPPFGFIGRLEGQRLNHWFIPPARRPGDPEYLKAIGFMTQNVEVFAFRSEPGAVRAAMEAELTAKGWRADAKRKTLASWYGPDGSTARLETSNAEIAKPPGATCLLITNHRPSKLQMEWFDLQRRLGF